MDDPQRLREKELIRLRVEQWRIADEFLERERAKRLARMTDDECREIVARLFSGPHPAPIERDSGLVAQQKVFHNLP